MTVDLYLRAADEAALIAALPWARGIDEDGDPIWLTGSHDYALVVIGTLVVSPGEYDEDGEEISPPVVAEGYHANLRCTEEIAALVPDEVIIAPEPETPAMEWF